MIQKIAISTVRAARQVIVAVVGFTVLLAGVIMLVTPGPGLIVIPLGLAILGIEFAFARSWLKRIRKRLSQRQSQDLARRAEQHRAEPNNVER